MKKKPVERESRYSRYFAQFGISFYHRYLPDTMVIYLDEINSWGERILFFVSPELKTTNFRHVSDYIERKKKKLALERKTMNLLSWSCQVNRAPARSLKENGFREKLQGRFHHAAGCVGNIDERLINQHT